MATPFHRILVATDFSADAERAVQVASELSRAYLAPLTVVHVYDPSAYPLPDGYLMYTPAQLSRLWEELERRLGRARGEALAAGATQVEARLLQGFVAGEIVRFAKEHDCDLIVMGTHGRSGLARAFLGSVAARVTRTAECPVLTVKRAEHRPEDARREAAAPSAAP